MKTLFKISLIFLLLWSTALVAKTQKLIATDYLVKDEIIKHDKVQSHVRTYAKDVNVGRYITIIPSLGRGVEDYTEKFNSTITTRLVEAGFRVILIQPRGVGKSRGDLTPANASMSMFAQDIKAVLDAKNIKKITLIGHAFGNRLARTFTTLYPSYVEALILMASGGNFEMNEKQKSCLSGSVNPKLDYDERLKAIECAFFAKGNDASVWMKGWYPELADAQVLASQMINGEFFKRAGGKSFMLIQAKEDFIAPPDRAGKILKAELGSQVTYVEIPHAGHALSSEQPELIVEEILGYLQ